MSSKSANTPITDKDAQETPSSKVPFKIRAERMSKELLDTLNRNVLREQNDPTYKPSK